MTKQLTLDETGDLSAEPGSKDWAVAVRLKLQALLDTVQSTEAHLLPYLEKLEETGGYKLLVGANGKPFENPLDFYEAPYPYGLGGHRKIERRIQALRKHGRPAGNGKPYNYKVFNDDYGTGQSYILARLARDHPDILAAYQRGEYRSARQAGIAAGFIKDVKRIQVLPDPEKIAAKCLEVLTRDQIQELIELLQDG